MDVAVGGEVKFLAGLMGHESGFIRQNPPVRHFIKAVFSPLF
jgi:hypothetical protein